MTTRNTYLAFLCLVIGILAPISANAHCGPVSSYKNHKGLYNKGKLYGLHRCAFTINKDAKGQKCAVTVTPDGKTFCE